jgi:DNA-binding NarL/FixJ family response regulator
MADELLRVRVVARNGGLRARLSAALAAAGIVPVNDPNGVADVLLVVFEAGNTGEAADRSRATVFLGGDPAVVRSRRHASGAWGWLPAAADGSAIAAAIRAVASGLSVLPPEVMARLPAAPVLHVDEIADAGTPPPEELTPRELDVLELVSQGLSNRAIGRRLGISGHTVKFHVASICGKLGATGRTGAVRTAIRRGLVRL